MSKVEIITADEDGSEVRTTIGDHIKKWHGFRSDHQWDDAHLERVHDREHATGDASVYDYHAHPES